MNDGQNNNVAPVNNAPSYNNILVNNTSHLIIYWQLIMTQLIVMTRLIIH